MTAISSQCGLWKKIAPGSGGIDGQSKAIFSWHFSAGRRVLRVFAEGSSTGDLVRGSPETPTSPRRRTPRASLDTDFRKMLRRSSNNGAYRPADCFEGGTGRKK